MKKLNILVGLITADNDFQVEQARAAEEIAAKLGIGVRIIYAGGDAINQSQQLLGVIQSSGEHPDAIVFEPVGGTALPHVARASVSAGIGWGVLNREAEYMKDLRRASNVPAFCVSTNHLEVGRIQGQHLAALVPKDGTALFIQGPTTTAAARHRTLGLEQTKPAGVKLISFKGSWTRESAYKALCSWMKLPTSKRTPVDMILAQNDDMAIGARKAIQEHADFEVKDKWLSMPFSGCDGLPKVGQEMVRNGLLAATVVTRPNSSAAIELMVHALRTATQPSELTLISPVSLPSLDQLNSSKLAQHEFSAR
ncbi:MAG TPA: sugar ABC transporter substrate-binding protein [Candidatus Limnocylindrales bacterium]|nr:sugar ABC transporter substrate-binding protein [Candidatus Limnocylindrales bacterium]